MSDKISVYKNPYNREEGTDEISLNSIAKSMSHDQFADFMEDFCNSYNHDFRQGLTVGKRLQTAHRTLQATVVRYLLGILVGLSEQDYTDARNEAAVTACKQIAAQIEEGDIKIGYMI